MRGAPPPLAAPLALCLLVSVAAATVAPRFCSSSASPPYAASPTIDPILAGANVTTVDALNMKAFADDVVYVSTCSPSFSAHWPQACDTLTFASATAQSWFPLWTLSMQGLVDLRNVTTGAANLLALGAKIVDAMNASQRNESVQSRLEAVWNASVRAYVNATLSSFVAADAAEANLTLISALFSNSSAPLAASLAACTALSTTTIPALNRTLQELQANLSACTTQACRVGVLAQINHTTLLLRDALARWSACAPYTAAMQAFARAAPLLLEVLQAHLFAYHTALADAHATHGGLVSFLSPFSASAVYTIEAQVIAQEVAAASPLIELFVASSCASVWA